jgi:hypothetical protein
MTDAELQVGTSGIGVTEPTGGDQGVAMKVEGRGDYLPEEIRGRREVERDAGEKRCGGALRTRDRGTGGGDRLDSGLKLSIN